MASPNCRVERAVPSAEEFDTEAMAAQATRATTLLSAMSNEKRLMILCQLIDRERSVNELTELLSAPQSTISRHLALLRREGLVKARQDGQIHYYSLAGDESREILGTLQTLFCRPQPTDA